MSLLQKLYGLSVLMRGMHVCCCSGALSLTRTLHLLCAQHQLENTSCDFACSINGFQYGDQDNVHWPYMAYKVRGWHTSCGVSDAGKYATAGTAGALPD